MPRIPRAETPTGGGPAPARRGPRTPRAPLSLGQNGLEGIGKSIGAIADVMEKQERTSQMNTLENETIKRLGELEGRAERENLSYSETLQTLESEIPAIKDELMDGVADNVVARRFEAVFDRHAIRSGIKVKASAAKRQQAKALDNFEANSETLANMAANFPAGSRQEQEALKDIEIRTFEAADAGLVDDPRQRMQDVRQTLALTRAEQNLARAYRSATATEEEIRKLKDPTTPEYEALTADARADKVSEAESQLRAAVNHEWSMRDRIEDRLEKAEADRQEDYYLQRMTEIGREDTDPDEWYTEADLDRDIRNGIIKDATIAKSLRTLIEGAAEDVEDREYNWATHNSLLSRAMDGEDVVPIAISMQQDGEIDRRMLEDIVSMRNSIRRGGGRLAKPEYKEADQFMVELVTGQLKGTLTELTSGEMLYGEVSKRVALARQKLRNRVTDGANPFMALRQIMPELMHQTELFVTQAAEPQHAQFDVDGKIDREATLREIKDTVDDAEDRAEAIDQLRQYMNATQQVEIYRDQVMTAITQRID